MSHRKIVRSYACEIRAAGDGRTLTGRAVPYDSPTTINAEYGSFTEVIKPGAFARSIAERGDRVRVLANHDRGSFPIGKPSRLWEQADGLYLESRIVDTQAGNEALALVRDGVVSGLSIGFRPVKADTSTDGVRTITEAALLEVSLTAFPAYDGAQVTSVRHALAGYLDELAALDGRPRPTRSTLSVALAERDLALLKESPCPIT